LDKAVVRRAFDLAGTEPYSKALALYEALELQVSSNTCFVHVRHGDSVDRSRNGGQPLCQDRHPILTRDYYQRALNYVVANHDIGAFLIFCDHDETMNLVRENFCFLKRFPHKLFFNDSAIIDFALMTLCDHAIIANSTFSWWAAWLKSYPGKMICCPEEQDWFGPRLRHLNTKDILPPEWVRIRQATPEEVR